MKKKVLFVIPSLEAGGAEKSLVNVLNCIDYDLYDIDLLLFSTKGIFLKQLPKSVNLLSISNDYTLFTSDLKYAFFTFIKKGNFRLAFSRILYTLILKLLKNKGKAEQYSWNYLKKSIKQFTRSYDVAIGFLEKSSIYFVVDCINAKKKIGFIHNDYLKLGLDAKFDLNYFEKLHTIASVSELCVKVLQAEFPSISHKIFLQYNIISEQLIHQLASEKVPLDTSFPSIISVGRLHPQKGFDLAIKAASLLKQQGVVFKWYIIGEGALRTQIETQIIENKLQQHFVLLGIMENPYPYMKQATIFVQPSRYEGKSIALDEAKLLQKPIIVTNFSTAKDQIEHLKNGLICEMNSESLANVIAELIQNESLQKKLAQQLYNDNLNNGLSMNSFYKLINGND